jgi:acetyl esterase
MKELMKISNKKIFVALLAIFFATASFAVEKSPRVKPDYSPADATYQYTGIFGEQQKLVVYYPDGWAEGKNYPCILLFHGGGWAGGDLSMFQYFCDYFASRELVAISANYKLCPKEIRGSLPEGTSYKRWSVMDAKSAIRWVKTNAGKLGIDPKKIILGGGSAGAHIATLALLDEEFNNTTDPDIDTDVAALLLFNPAYTIPENEPIQDVNEFRKMKPVLPRSIIFYGSKDGWKISNFDHLVPLLKKQGTQFEEWIAQGEGHSFFDYVLWCDVVLAKSDEFLCSMNFIQGTSPLIAPATGERLIKGASNK